MLPKNYILDLQRKFLSMEQDLAKTFRACLIPLRKLPNITDPDEAMYLYALSRKLLRDSSRVYENRFFRTFSQTDFKIIYTAALQKIFAETNQRIAIEVSNQEAINFSLDINLAFDLLLPKLVFIVYGITRNQGSFASISRINCGLKSVILYEIAKSGLFAKCTSDIYSVIDKQMLQTFNAFDENLENLIFNGKRYELAAAWKFSDFYITQLQEEYLSKMITEDPLCEQDAILSFWPETSEYSIANLYPYAIRRQFVQAFTEYWFNDQMFEQFDLELECKFEHAFKQKFCLSIQEFRKVINEQSVHSPAQTKAQLCKSAEVARLHLQLVATQVAKKFVAINQKGFFESYEYLMVKNNLRSDRSIRLMLADLFADLVVAFQDRHRGSLGMSSHFVWPRELLADIPPRSPSLRNLSL